MTTLEERPAPAEIGQPRRRKEDAHFITGRTVWTDNITLPGLLHLAILRSPMAHAKITSINTAAAPAVPASSRCSPDGISPKRKAASRARGRSRPTS